MTLTTIVVTCRRTLRGWKKYFRRIVLVLAMVAFVSAFVGVMRLPADGKQADNPSRSSLDRATGAFYEAAQVLLLNMETHRGPEFNFCIGLARVSAVLLVGLVAIKAISVLFQDYFDNFRFGIAGRRSVFIGGLGRIGFQLAIDYCQQNKFVVVEEVANPDHRVEAVEDHGAIVIEGDVTDISSLRDHVFRDPAIIHLVTGDDGVNVNALLNIKSLREEFRKRKHWFGRRKRRLGKCECYVHVDDPGLHGTLQRCLIETTGNADPQFAIHPFNIHRETASQLVFDKLTPIRPSKDQVAFYVIFGLEQMGMAMLRELVEFAHFENQKRARILVVVPPGNDGKAAENAYQECIAQWSRLTPRFVYDDLTEVEFDPACDEWSCQKKRPEVAAATPAQAGEVEYAANVHFCSLQSNDFIGREEAIALARLAGATESNSHSESKVKAAMLFCFEEDERNFRMANELNVRWQDIDGINVPLGDDVIKDDNRSQYRRHFEFQLPIYAFLPRSGPLRDILAQSTDRFAIRPFGAVKEGIERAHDQLIEQVAMDIAWAYDAESIREQARIKWCEANQCERNNTPLEAIPIGTDAGLKITPRDQYQSLWNGKPFWEQVSNRNAARHAKILMQVLGFSFAKSSSERGSSNIDFEAFEEDDKVLIAKIEHNRWMAERLLMGWTFGPRMKQPPQRQTFCPNEVLKKDTTEWMKDFNQIKTILEYLEKHGALFHRVTGFR